MCTDSWVSSLWKAANSQEAFYRQTHGREVSLGGSHRWGQRSGACIQRKINIIAMAPAQKSDLRWFMIYLVKSQKIRAISRWAQGSLRSGADPYPATHRPRWVLPRVSGEDCVPREANAKLPQLFSWPTSLLSEQLFIFTPTAVQALSLFSTKQNW